MRSDSFTPDYATLGVYYRQMHRIVDRWDSRLRELGLERRKFLVLLAIKSSASCPAGPSIGGLAKSTLFNRNVIREIVTALVRQGLVTRARDRGDRRRTAIALTPLGDEWLALLVRDDATSMFRNTSPLHTRMVHDDRELRNPVTSANSVA